MKKDYKIPCKFGTDVAEFEHYVGRPPRNSKEMEDWVHLLKKGVDAQLDWDMIGQNAAENLR